MKQIFILTACQKDAKEHYKDTIEKLVDFTSLHKDGIISDELFKRILEEFPSGKARVWGNLPTKEKDVYLDDSQTSYKMLKPGDIIFTYINWKERKQRIDAVTQCGMKLRSKELAQTLWQTNKEGHTWEYIFLLKNTKFIDFPSKKLSINRKTPFLQNGDLH